MNMIHDDMMEHSGLVFFEWEVRDPLRLLFVRVDLLEDVGEQLDQLGVLDPGPLRPNQTTVRGVYLDNSGV